MNQDLEQGQVRIYSAGGCGIGIVSYFEQDRGKTQEGSASLHPVYVDTSRSALIGKDIANEHFYKLEGDDGQVDGSGGLRGDNAAGITERNLEILQAFPPMDLNIIVSSASGGSGAVFAYSLARELIARDKVVVCLLVGADDSRQQIENTTKALVSYENIVHEFEKPLVVHYTQNGRDGTVAEVDKRIRDVIATLTMLFSRQNEKLDSRDLYNWVNFNRVTSYAPQVGVLSIHKGQVKTTNESLISVVTLNPDMENTKLDQPVDYQRVGIPTFIKEELYAGQYPIHYAITDGFLDGVVKDLRKQTKEYVSNAAARVVRNKLSDGTETKTKTGLVI